VLASGRGSNLGAILEACRHDEFPARVVVVVSDRERAPALERAREAGVAALFLDPKAYGDRAAYDEALVATLERHRPGLVCLAGFMRLLSPAFVGAWAGRLMNVHPSLLPAFPGLDTHARALAAGVKIHGCTVHFVTPALDQGPVVIQAALPVRAADSAQTLAARVLKLEHVIYPRAVKWFLEDRLVVDGGTVSVKGNDADGDAQLIVSPD